MKRLIVVLLLIFGFWYFDYTQDLKNRESLKNIESQFAHQKDMVLVGGSFEPYKPEKLQYAKEGKVVLFFNASWCPTCSTFTDELKQVKLPSNVLLLSVDFDTNFPLREKYKVALQHTFVEVDENGGALHKWSGGGVEELKKQLKIN